MKECLLKRISIANWQYSSIHDRSFALDPERSSNKDRLQTAISELKVNVDENRFEQELIYYLEKLDITEEKYV
jgi:uncharacterized protein YicC (UPF0701 family)